MGWEGEGGGGGYLSAVLSPSFRRLAATRKGDPVREARSSADCASCAWGKFARRRAACVPSRSFGLRYGYVGSRYGYGSLTQWSAFEGRISNHALVVKRGETGVAFLRSEAIEHL